MISCPNCGREIPDDVAHCGHCGHRIEVEQKKTMMGMGALDLDQLKDDVEKGRKAKEKRQAQQKPDSASEESEENDELAATELLDQFNPPGADAEPGDSGDASAPEEGGEELMTAPTAAMDAVDFSDESDQEAAPPPRPGEGPSKQTSLTPPADLIGGSASEPSEPTPEAKSGGVELASDVATPPGGPSSEQKRVEIGSPGAEASLDDTIPEAPPAAEEGLAGGQAMDESEPVSKEPDDDSAPESPGPGMAQMQQRFGGGGGDEEAFDSFEDVEDQGKGRTILLIGVVLFVVMGCCAATSFGIYSAVDFDAIEEAVDE